MYDTKLQGIHFPHSGQVILTSTTPKKYCPSILADNRFEGIPLLPYLTSDNTTFAVAKDFILQHLENSMRKHASYQAADTDEQTNPFRPLQCDMILFLSILPLSGISRSSLAIYENEIRFPTGQTTVRPPPMEVSAVMFSPDCGTALEWRDEPAVKVERFWRAGRVVGIAAALIAGAQVWWVLKEMGERGSPSVFPLTTELMGRA
jgi:hypothetical protein